MTANATLLGTLHAVDGEGVVRMEDRFDAGIEDLWSAFTDPARLAQWYGVVEGELSQGMPVELLPAYGAGIQIHVEHLADYIGGRELHVDDSRWDELFAAYEAQGVS